MTNVATPSLEQVRQIEFRAMGSEMLAAVDSAVPEAAALLDAVPGWFAAWEAALSRFNDESELSRLNQTAGSGTLIPVSATLWTVLQQALAAAEATSGLVTPTVLNALEAAGYRGSFDAMRHAAAGGIAAADRPALPPPARGFTRWREIEVDPVARAVRLPAGVRLDFGGVAKGWAAGEAVRRLAVAGPALVNAGGDIAVSGPLRDGTGWPIGIDAPLGLELPPDTPLALIDLRAGGIATSGRDYRRWQQNGTWQHHLIDPRSGTPADTDVLAATVIAPTASEAEIAAKVALLLGSADGLAWLDARPALAGLLVRETGEVLPSRRLPDFLEHP
jgi:thiamine biosynthesis lipoprotein